MAIPPRVVDLVDQFHRDLNFYHSPIYNETQARQEFIDPLFEALGWDIGNRKGAAAAFREVIFEFSMKIGDTVKAPDYFFRLDAARQFFVEAKKPSVNIQSGIGPAYQVRRYAWTAKHPLGVLTDFDEFAVYDTRVEPDKNDKSTVARYLYLPYTEYASRWDDIAALFSREAVLAGSLDTFAEAVKAPKGALTVDKAFLREIEGWRELLARDIALWNEGLSQRELNYLVQMTLDRIIFLRICEDRGIEPYGRLQELLIGGDKYNRLLNQFRDADDRYNSGLFHFKDEKGREDADTLSTRVYIGDEALQKLIRNLYYPDSPYEFSVLPVEVLGNVYEQFLGKVITLGSKKTVTVEEKPEVRKAGGVYYTPAYIVEYIVKNTVGKLLEGKTPKEVSALRVCDPACGSGSFLIGAYQFLLDWHRNKYVEIGPQKHRKELYQAPGGDWRLTTSERKRILLNNIYGVDIDTQAVEVTKLSLCLKMLEGETGQSLVSQLQMFRERALPDLGSNIKCGNSLIGPDFYQQEAAVGLGEEEIYRVNAFDWQSEFKAVMTAGGFDAVIGNPPYGIPFSGSELAYLNTVYSQARKFPDSYCLFMVKALRITRSSGYLSLIVPNTFCDLEGCDDFRKWLLENISLECIWQTGWAFKSAIVDTLVFVIENITPNKEARVTVFINDGSYSIPISKFAANDLYKIDYRNKTEDDELFRKVTNQATPLASLATVRAGVKLYEKGKGTPPQTEETLKVRPYTTKDTCPEGWRVLYRGGNITRYTLEKSDEFVHYGPWLAAPRTSELFISPKIIMRRTDDRLFASLETQSAICVNSCHIIQFKDTTSGLSYEYLLGLVNSRLLQKVFEFQNPQMVGKVFAEIKVIYVERLPIRIIDFTIPTDKKCHDEIVILVERMLDLNKRLPEAKTAQERTILQRQIEATDRQIDTLVYTLYDLTADEIKVVEDATK